MWRGLGLSVVLAAGLALSGCGNDDNAGDDPNQINATAVPETSLCRNLTREAMALPTNASDLVDCSEPHNAETYAAGELPEEFTSAAYDDPAMVSWSRGECATQLRTHLGVSESVAMRSVFTSIWFRPSAKAWEKGARWWRCDIVAGGDKAQKFLDLPTKTAKLLADRPDDQWMACARGEDVNTGTKVACNQPHSWRAVTTIKVGEPEDAWPGAAEVEAKTKQYCSSSVAAWLDYPTDYLYGYTWFGEEEWSYGARRSVCWAKTEE